MNESPCLNLFEIYWAFDLFHLSIEKMGIFRKQACLDANCQRIEQQYKLKCFEVLYKR